MSWEHNAAIIEYYVAKKNISKHDRTSRKDATEYPAWSCNISGIIQCAVFSWGANSIIALRNLIGPSIGNLSTTHSTNCHLSLACTELGSRVFSDFPLLLLRENRLFSECRNVTRRKILYISVCNIRRERENLTFILLLRVLMSIHLLFCLVLLWVNFSWVISFIFDK